MLPGERVVETYGRTYVKGPKLVTPDGTFQIEYNEVDSPHFNPNGGRIEIILDERTRASHGPIDLKRGGRFTPSILYYPKNESYKKLYIDTMNNLAKELLWSEVEKERGFI